MNGTFWIEYVNDAAQNRAKLWTHLEGRIRVTHEKGCEGSVPKWTQVKQPVPIHTIVHIEEEN